MSKSQKFWMSLKNEPITLKQHEWFGIAYATPEERHLMYLYDDSIRLEDFTGILENAGIPKMLIYYAIWRDLQTTFNYWTYNIF